MTNVAMALRKEPRLAAWLRAISCMGGTTQVGNTTPVAEFNIWCDPEAADIVFASGVPLWLVGLNVTRQVGLTARDIERLNAGGRVARTYGALLGFFRDRLNEIHGLSSASLHDPCALVPFIVPDLITYARCPVEIEAGDGLTRGMTVCDFRNLTTARLANIRPAKRANCEVAVAVDARPLVDHIMDAILAWPERGALDPPPCAQHAMTAGHATVATWPVAIDISKHRHEALIGIRGKTCAAARRLRTRRRASGAFRQPLPAIRFRCGQPFARAAACPLPFLGGLGAAMPRAAFSLAEGARRDDRWSRDRHGRALR